MEILGFFGGVWASVIIGLFVIAMVVGCTFDRHYNESPKWWIFLLGVIALLAWQWDKLQFNWDGVMSLFTAAIWMPVLYYVLLGLAYSVLEFVLEVRRSAKYWRNTWGAYKQAWDNRGTAKAEKSRNVLDAMTSKFREEPQVEEEPTEDPAITTQKKLTAEFISRYGEERNYSKRIIGIEKAEGGIGIEPKVNRQQLAENVGVWTFFWPFYLISLIVGDLFTEIFNIVADFLASISGRFVRMSFQDVFKF